MRISKVLKDSIAEEIGISVGDILLSINNFKITDILDYGYYTTKNDLIIEIEKQNNEIWEYDIEKHDDEELGLIFDESIEEQAKSCNNKCLFCFIDQLPKGMRDTLYFKDDDTRMSFLHGNYVTLTNTKKEDIEKIIKYRLSPINISVHTTNPLLRIKMMKNKNAGNVMEILKNFVENNIKINCQIVLCKGINDGNELERTINDLLKLGVFMNSLSIVPVGITKHRDGLYELQEFNKEDSISIINTVLKYQKENLEKFGNRKLFLADEFYLKAEMELPSFNDYEDFPQIENGVGMLKSFYQEAKDHILKIKLDNKINRKVSIATGELAYKVINELVGYINEKIPYLNIQVFKIENKFFGNTVGVAGLLTGEDILNQLEDIDIGEALYISKNMLRSGENILLDDITTDIIEVKLKVKVIPVENDGVKFIEKIIKDI